MLTVCAALCFAHAPANATPVEVGTDSPTTTTYTLTVDTSADTIALDGKCSLREAVAIANRVFDASNDCPLVTSSKPWDTIQFDVALNGTTLTVASALVFNASAFVTVQSQLTTPPAVVKIDGNNATRILDIAAGANVTIKYVILQRGKTTGSSPDADGGAVRNAGALTLNNCTLQINSSSGSGGAVASTGFLTVVGSSFSNNSAGSGGAILSGDSLSMDHGYVANNYGFTQGGGIDLRGPNATITNTTMATNHTGTIGGGGIFIAPGAGLNLSTSMIGGNTATGSGGGIESFGQFNVSNSTFNGNTSTGFGGAISQEVAMATANTIKASTFAANTAGGNALAAQQGGIALRHSLLAGDANCNGTITDAGGNIAADASCGLGASSLSMTDPQLQILANYGGSTMSMPPAPTSPAIDVINAIDCDGATDQRGTLRPQGGKCDVGAVERETDRIFADGFELWP